MISSVSSPSDRNGCVLSCLYVCVFYPSGSVGKLVTGVFQPFIILDGRKPLYSYNFSLSFSSWFLSIANRRLSSSNESFRGYLVQNGLWIGNIRTDVFGCGVHSAHL